MKPLATALAFVAILVLAAPALRAADTDPGARVARVEQWIKAVLRHTPGDPDASVVEVSGWSDATLDVLRLDINVLIRLMRDPRLTSFQLPDKELDCVDCFAARRDVTQARILQQGRVIRYTDEQLHRMKVLACAAAGILEDSICKRLEAKLALDGELQTLALDGELQTLAARAAAAKRAGDGNFLVKRAALLHMDVAIVTAGALRPVESGAPGDSRGVRVHMVDGEATDIGLGDSHWAIGRELLAAVRPEGDAMVRLWYQATSMWMQREQQYNRVHVQQAREAFPDDALLAFLSGSHEEAYASGLIQAVVKTAVLPTGTVLRIGNESAELRSAEGFLQRAVKLDPQFVEARLHLGHVLVARGNPRAALVELTAIETTPDLVFQYHRLMFLGAAEEALGRPDEARAAYERASTIFPRAQSPYLALSALDARRGERNGAAKAIAQVFALPAAPESRDDPWWRYSVLQGRNTDDLLEQLRRPFREGRQ